MQVCGRYFSTSEIDWINTQVATVADLDRTRLSRMFCRHVSWYKPDGGLKDMSCRVALLRLEEKGLIKLPAARTKNGVAKPVRRTRKGEPRQEIRLEAGRAELVFEPADKSSAPLWNELIDRYHYLGYCRTGGAQMRLFVYADKQLVALLGFSAAAWKVAARDDYIGWNSRQRKDNLYLVANNSRFLILPWVRAKNLASQILSHTAKHLPALWQERYGYRPVLFETFVDTQRFAGTCYKAANWICAGTTRGRGKHDRHNACAKPVKTVWVYPVNRDFRKRLCR